MNSRQPCVHYTRTLSAGNPGNVRIRSRLALHVLTPDFNIPTTMAAKKTAKKTAETLPNAPAKPTAPAARKAAKKAVRKVATKTDAKKAPAAKAPKAAAPKPTTDAIARAAYLIYRKRVELGLPGDSHNDWLEAERQLGVIR